MAAIDCQRCGEMMQDDVPYEVRIGQIDSPVRHVRLFCTPCALSLTLWWYQIGQPA